jgi:hypothetical protein
MSTTRAGSMMSSAPHNRPTTSSPGAIVDHRSEPWRRQNAA